MHDSNEYVYFIRAEEYYKISPSAKGVYAWYVAPPSDLSHNYIKEINTYYSSMHSAAMGEKITGSRYSVEIRRQAISITEAISRKKVGMEFIEPALRCLSEFTSPLYVGVAVGEDGIRQRIKNEFNGLEFKRKFVVLAEKAGVTLNFNFEDSVIKYLDVNEMLGSSATEEEVRNLSELIEVISFWAEFPALNIKKGN